MTRQRKSRDVKRTTRGHAQALLDKKTHKKAAKPAKPAAKKQAKTMATVDVIIDANEAGDIVQPVIDGQMDAEWMAQDMWYEWGW